MQTLLMLLTTVLPSECPRSRSIPYTFGPYRPPYAVSPSRPQYLNPYCLPAVRYDRCPPWPNVYAGEYSVPVRRSCGECTTEAPVECRTTVTTAVSARSAPLVVALADMKGVNGINGMLLAEKINAALTRRGLSVRRSLVVQNIVQLDTEKMANEDDVHSHRVKAEIHGDGRSVRIMVYSSGENGAPPQSVPDTIRDAIAKELRQ